MPDTKITALTELAAADVLSGDMLPIVDVSVGASDSANKKISVPSILAAGLALNPMGFVPDFRIANVYFGPEGNAVNQTCSLAANREYYQPVFVPTRMTVSSIGVNVTTTGACNIKLAIYAAAQTSDGGMIVGAKLADGAAPVSMNSAVGAAMATVSPSVDLEPGWYFFAFIADATAAAVRATTNNFGSIWTVVAASASSTLGLGYYRGGTYASGLPADMTSTTPTGSNSGGGFNMPAIFTRP